MRLHRPIGFRLLREQAEGALILFQRGGKTRACALELVREQRRPQRPEQNCRLGVLKPLLEITPGDDERICILFANAKAIDQLSPLFAHAASAPAGMRKKTIGNADAQLERFLPVVAFSKKTLR